ncbi:arylamine N-acetyltransferase [Rhizocola hellebori]|uniref:Arylamine N-acetyltransferase n=1 Tax=Rhizocola hellebori TaxID=1392758 RepID=A0A8J3VLK4_9ACTN|nr:arylamine N-acetyltransferase [Rhizocola hellebori]GIH10930.1 arylamine N-acetyltransferase [Rhizocola hellebori]
MIDAYLARLGLPRAKPSVDYLFELHRAHVAKVAYTNLQIIRDRPASIALESSVAEVLAGRNGYCFHLNGAFAELLRSLGFQVSLHRGYVVRLLESEAALNHLVLVVHDLDGMWFVDAGLGDALYEPLPLTPGTYRQGPFQYRLEPCARRDGWRFEHDPEGSFGAMEFESAGARIADFAQAHEHLSTSPSSTFRRFLVAQVREAGRVRILRGCILTTIDRDGKREEHLDDPQRWRDTIVELGVADEGLLELWPTEREKHEAWLASK